MSLSKVRSKKKMTFYLKIYFFYLENMFFQRDFAPRDVLSVYQPPKKAPQRPKDGMKPKLDDTTTFKTFFKSWEVTPRVRQGDFQEKQAYAPPTEKFEATTTTGTAFIGLPGETAKACKPVDGTLESGGGTDFGTVYRKSYGTPLAAKRLNKSQAEVVLRELRKRKQGMSSKMDEDTQTAVRVP